MIASPKRRANAFDSCCSAVRPREASPSADSTHFARGSWTKIHAAMAGLDILLHPSSAEGLGTAVIDAMALGIPPIAFRVGGLPELIEDGRSGVLVPAGDIAAFAAATDRLVCDSDASRVAWRRPDRLARLTSAWIAWFAGRRPSTITCSRGD